eukprot:scaffold83424_cov15-Tisochrysis_lutea.AAC.1
MPPVSSGALPIQCLHLCGCEKGHSMLPVSSGVQQLTQAEVAYRLEALIQKNCNSPFHFVRQRRSSSGMLPIIKMYTTARMLLTDKGHAVELFVLQAVGSCSVLSSCLCCKLWAAAVCVKPRELAYWWPQSDGGFEGTSWVQARPLSYRNKGIGDHSDTMALKAQANDIGDHAGSDCFCWRRGWAEWPGFWQAKAAVLGINEHFKQLPTTGKAKQRGPGFLSVRRCLSAQMDSVTLCAPITLCQESKH